MAIDEKITQSPEPYATDRPTWEIDDNEDARFAASMARRATELIDAGRIEAAERQLKVGLQRCPDHPACLSGLAVCLAVGDKRFVSAEKLARQVIEDNPGDGRALYALGRVNLAGERRKFAFRHFDRSRSLAPDDEVLAQDLDRAEPRRAPVFPFLPRDNFLNRVFGRLRARLFPSRGWSPPGWTG